MRKCFPSSANYVEYTGYDIPTSLRGAFELDRRCGNTLWTDAFITEFRLQRRTTVQFRIDTDEPTILPLFSIEHHWRHRVRLCSPPTTFAVNDSGPLINAGVGSHHQDPYKLNPFERPHLNPFERPQY